MRRQMNSSDVELADRAATQECTDEIADCENSRVANYLEQAHVDDHGLGGSSRGLPGLSPRKYDAEALHAVPRRHCFTKFDSKI
jgi:hypothetical protein